MMMLIFPGSTARNILDEYCDDNPRGIEIPQRVGQCLRLRWMGKDQPADVPSEEWMPKAIAGFGLRIVQVKG